MTDFVLFSSPASPFGRKVKIAAAILGLSDRIAVEKTDTSQPDSRLRRENPLGKIPVLIDASGRSIYDSRVIVEYLDLLAGGGRILPADPKIRIAALRLQALADGIMDAALLRRYESLRPPAERSASWDAGQAGKVERGLAALEASPPAPGPITVGEIAVACALGYLDFRFDGAWRAAHPALVAWLAAFEAEVPSFGATTPTG